ENAIVLGKLEAIKSTIPAFVAPAGLKEDAYLLKTLKSDGESYLIITGPNDRGVLYGAFALLRKIGLCEPINNLNDSQQPYAPVRMLDQWDNLDGTIERGYAGPSIFFEKGDVVSDLTRVRDYARLMASVGINACSINNVNANPRVVTTAFLPELVRLAEAFRSWGVRLFVSIEFSSPRKIGGLDTFDPLEPGVADFWKKTIDGIYRSIPDFGGFVLKADSEGRLGPSAYHRSHADAANVIARPLAEYGGLIFYRGFVYDHHMDWRNLKNDRAAAAYNNFKQLDGQFLDNVVLQIKHGPIDFQVREPASPLFGGLEKTNQAIELQITQEYTGQQRHLVYLVPMWKEVLDFDMQAHETSEKDGHSPQRHSATEPQPKGSREGARIAKTQREVFPEKQEITNLLPRERGGDAEKSWIFSQVHGGGTPVKDLVAGRTFSRPLGGFVGVANVGASANWLGHHLAMANLYGFGRLAWDPDLSAR